MISYFKTEPHNIYKKGSTEELEMIDEQIRKYILKGKTTNPDFHPTRNQADAIYLFSKFENIEIEKDDGRYLACIYTGTTKDNCEYGSQLVFFVEAESLELAISLAAYESIKYYG